MSYQNIKNISLLQKNVAIEEMHLKLMLNWKSYFHLQPWEYISVKFETKNNNFYWRKINLKMPSANQWLFCLKVSSPSYILLINDFGHLLPGQC